MKKVVLISCVSKKQPYIVKAEDLYISPLFKLNLKYAQKLNPDFIFILSAKYGLLNLDTQMEPYNLTLNSMAADQIKMWSSKVLEQLAKFTDLKYDHFIFLAGQKYRKYLLPHLTSYEVPLAGLTIGKQIQHLKQETS